MKPRNGVKFAVLIGIVVLTVSSIISYAIIYFFQMPSIHLDGSKEMTINYKSKYKEPGYQATYYKKDKTKNIKIYGKVNTNKLGIYKLKYVYKKGFFKKFVVRTVKVRDLEKPVITFDDDRETIYVCPKKAHEIKYNAYDNYDKDLTTKVKVSKKDNIIKYVVADSSGNITMKQKKVFYEDHENPSLNLISGDTATAFLNETYTDPGYEVFDNCDVLSNDEVNIDGVVNTGITGTYILTYKVTDSSGNITIKKRTVNVVKRNSAGTIYLTFDDGPRMGTTNVILDILKEEGIKATFFVTNNGPDELIKREYDEGHSIGLHTASHNYAVVYGSTDSYFNDLSLVHDRVFNITGYDSKLIRFPGGSSNTISRKYTPGIMSTLTNEVLRRGYKYYDWNIDSGDAESHSDTATIYNRVTTHLSHDKVNVILMHDVKSYTRDALKSIIAYAKSNGYHFETITNETDMITQRVNN